MKRNIIIIAILLVVIMSCAKNGNELKKISGEIVEVGHNFKEYEDKSFSIGLFLKIKEVPDRKFNFNLYDAYNWGLTKTKPYESVKSSFDPKLIYLQQAKDVANELQVLKGKKAVLQAKLSKNKEVYIIESLEIKK